MTLWALFISIVTAAQPATVSLPPCGLDSLPACSTLAAAPLDAAALLGTPRNGGVVFNLTGALKPEGFDLTAGVIGQQLRANAIVTDQQAKKSLALARRLRQRAIEFIAGDSSPLSADQKAAIVRLRSVKIQMIPTSNTFCSRQVRVGEPNSAYFPRNHTIGICPSGLNLAEAMLTQMVFHELGHVVQTCNTKYRELYQTSGTTLKKVYACDPSLKTAPESQESMELKRLVTSPNVFAVEDSQSVFAKSLLKCGVIKKVTGGSAPDFSLFSQTDSCLDSRFKTPKTGIDALLAVSNPDAPLIASITACLSNQKEAFADAFSARLIASMKVSQAEFKTSFLNQQAYACYQRATNKLTAIDHPADLDRITAFVNEPVVAKRLGCEPQITSTTCNLIMESSPAAPRTSNPSTRKSRGHQ